MAETFDRLLEVNLASAVVLSRRLVPDMRDRGRGTVVHINSVAGLIGYPTGLSYGISKHGMLGIDVADAVWMACSASPRTVVEEILLRPQLGDL